MWIHRYTLKPRRALSALAGARPREGALLRAGDGFADVHPWPELGDAPLDEQLARLGRGETTPLTRRSLWFASVWKRDLFDGLTIPRSHWPGSDPPEGFDIAKIKMPGGTLPDRVRLRLDFNADADAFARLAPSLPRERIDFVEDPCPYDEETWRRLREETGMRFALDRAVAVPTRARARARARLFRRAGAATPYDVRIVKPAVEDVPKSDIPIIITSYMDHPIGQLHAAYVAANSKETCGLVTHVLYETDAFIERMTIKDARLIPPDFTDLLEALPWKRL
jgi:O-succinylbenzoate synthase